MAQRPSEVIDLVSDDDDEQGYYTPSETLDDDSVDFERDPESGGRGAEDPVDLTGLLDVPDVDVAPDSPAFGRLPTGGVFPRHGDTPPPRLPAFVTVAPATLDNTECLQRVLDILPDISVDHTLKLMKERIQNWPCTPEDCGQLINHILEGGSYPTERDEHNERKRKRVPSEENEFARFEKIERYDDPTQHALAYKLLKDEFPLVPVHYIHKTLNGERTLFKAYKVIEEQLHNYNEATSGFRKINKPRPSGSHEANLSPDSVIMQIDSNRNPTTLAVGYAMVFELRAARKKREEEHAKRLKQEEEQRAENENLLRAQQNNEMGECQCCFEDLPMNRMVICNGTIAHPVCLTCAKRGIEEEMSKGRCQPKCFTDTACSGTFTRKQLQTFLGVKSFQRLERLQQQAELVAAGLDYLDECPFCDFKAEYPPVELDKEFRCLNPECEKVSCRLCKTETHIPMSCEEAKKDKSINVRHLVEEAMSSALIRNCNQCKNPFVKDHGCNKMTCTKCGNVQCYICSQNVRNYEHFGAETNSSRCPLHDNVEQRHADEVQKAEREVLARLRAEHPDIPEEELKIQVSDGVKRAEQARMGI